MNGLCQQCQVYYPMPDDFGSGVPYACPQCEGLLVAFEVPAEPPDASSQGEFDTLTVQDPGSMDDLPTAELPRVTPIEESTREFAAAEFAQKAFAADDEGAAPLEPDAFVHEEDDDDELEMADPDEVHTAEYEVAAVAALASSAAAGAPAGAARSEMVFELAEPVASPAASGAEEDWEVLVPDEIADGPPEDITLITAVPEEVKRLAAQVSGRVPARGQRIRVLWFHPQASPEVDTARARKRAVLASGVASEPIEPTPGTSTFAMRGAGDGVSREEIPTHLPARPAPLAETLEVALAEAEELDLEVREPPPAVADPPAPSAAVVDLRRRVTTAATEPPPRRGAGIWVAAAVLLVSVGGVGLWYASGGFGSPKRVAAATTAPRNAPSAPSEPASLAEEPEAHADPGAGDEAALEGTPEDPAAPASGTTDEPEVGEANVGFGAATVPEAKLAEAKAAEVKLAEARAAEAKAAEAKLAEARAAEAKAAEAKAAEAKAAEAKLAEARAAEAKAAQAKAAEAKAAEAKAAEAKAAQTKLAEAKAAEAKAAEAKAAEAKAAEAKLAAAKAAEAKAAEAKAAEAKAAEAKAAEAKAAQAKAAADGTPTESGVVLAAADASGEAPSRERSLEHMSAGNQLFRQGKIDQAIQEFEKALLLDSRNAYAHRGLGVAYAKLGRAEDAAREYELYLKLSPDAPDAAQVRAIVEAYYAQKER